MEGNSGPSGVRWGKELLVMDAYTALSIMKSFPQGDGAGEVNVEKSLHECFIFI